MSQIKISHLTFSYDRSADTIFDDVSFQLDTHWRLGFLGRNGRGKTTFLQLLMGNYSYQGTITASVPFAYFPYSSIDLTKNTKEVIQSISDQFEAWQLLIELQKLAVSEEVLTRPFATLSAGERTKVLLAAFFLTPGRFPLIDEPTNHLDVQGRALVSQYLHNKEGFLLVSHDRAFLDGCIDHVLSINRSKIEVQKGNYTTWQHNKDLQDAFEQNQNEKLKREIKVLAESAQRTSNWSTQIEKTKYHTKNSGLRPDRGYIGHKAAKMMKRSKGLEQRKQSAAAEKATLLKDIDSYEALSLSPLPFHKQTLVTFSSVSVFYGSHTACQNISFSCMQGDRIALVGKNGAGKSSILKLILKEPIAYQGEIHLASGLKISYLPQDTSFLSGGLRDFVEEHQLEETRFKTILRKLGFSRAQFDNELQFFSEGQKKKTLLAKSLCEPAHLYLWDEPLNYVDILSRIQLEELLLSVSATILFVEHDNIFMERIATKQIVL